MNEYFVQTDSLEISFRVNETVLTSDGIEIPYELTEITPVLYILRLGNKSYQLTVMSSVKGEEKYLIDGNYINANAKSKLEYIAAKIIANTNKGHHKSTVNAPMPGMVLKLKKTPGERVEQGEAVLVLEAMKMENEVKSPYSGVIKEIFVAEKMAIEKGARLFSIE